MKGLLIVLCALVTTAAALAGGCALLVTGLAAAAAPQPGDAAALLWITTPVIAVTAAVAVANIALIAALGRGRAPRRTVWFLLLAVVDFVVAGILVAGGLAGQGGVGAGNPESFFLPGALALKGLLTLLLPAEPSSSSPPDAARGDA